MYYLIGLRKRKNRGRYNSKMPQIEKFRDLCRRQKNRHLLKGKTENIKNSEKLEILVADNNRHSTSMERVSKSKNCSTIEILPETPDTDVLQSDDNIESTNESTNTFVIFNNARERKPTLQDRL